MQSQFPPIILAIDTSCDDTAVAVTRGASVLSNVISSQVELHRKYGGVMPLVAKLAHHQYIHPTYQEALKRAGIKESDIDIIAVTYGPGLAIALEVGIDYAKQLAKDLDKPLIAVNHMLGHLFSSLAVNSNSNPNLNIQYLLPAIGFLVSGGHTELILIEQDQNNQFELCKIGQTLDDAAGEALDKFARMIGFGYPGASAMEEMAKFGNSNKYHFPLPLTQTKTYDFSFSGLKTSGRHAIEKITGNKLDDPSTNLTKQQIFDLSASYQYAVIRHLIYKLNKALEAYPQIKSIWLGGGVINNLAFRKAVRKLAKQYNIKHGVKFPYNKKLISDNAGMIGVAAYFQYLNKDFITDFNSLQRIPRLEIK